MEVSGRHAISANVKLTWNSRWHEPKPSIEHIKLCVSNGTTDGDLAIHFNGAHRGPYCRLSRPVQIPNFFHQWNQVVCEISRQRLTAAKYSQLEIPRPSCRSQHLPRRRRRLHHCRATLLNSTTQL